MAAHAGSAPAESAAAGTGRLQITEEFARALAILDGGGHMFLTGKAGTGKSTLIRHFMERTDRSVLVAAPTGIAALNVNGYTLHRLFGFRPTTTVQDIVTGAYRPGRLASALKSVDVLIIDEASMVRADLFDMIAIALEKYGPQPGLAFGGVQLVLVGDLFQLPPVVREAEEQYFTTHYPTPYFFSAERFDRDSFPTVALTHVFRQAGDPALTTMLNALREGLLLKDAQADLNKRTAPTFTPPPGEFWLTLAPTNRIVTARNRQHLAELPGDEAVAVATESGELDAFERPVEATLHVKVGAQIMMLNNDPAGEWVNGSLGKIVTIRRDETSGGVSSVEVQLADGSVVDVFPYTWEVTRPVVDNGTLRHDVVGTFTQLPLKLAWAITIHKSQGQTLDHVIVDLTGGAFAFGQVYVALSRCTSLDGLVLTRPILAKDLKTDRRILRFLREATEDGVQRRRCAMSVLTVGEEGRMSRPRPVEIAVAFDDDTAISTLINPQRDLADAKTAYGISTQDVLLAPTLPEAWAVLAPALEGAVPVGFGTDTALGLIDFELKRLGVVTPLPLGVELPASGLTAEEQSGMKSTRAMDRARTALRVAARRDDPAESSSPFESFADDERPVGFLLTRDSASTLPRSAITPTLTALLRTSAVVSAVILDGASAQDLRDRAFGAADTSLGPLVRDRLAGAIRHSAGLPPDLRTRVTELEALFGIDVWEAVGGSEGGGADAAPTIDEVLQPQTRVCFTGSVIDPDGAPVSKAELEALVENAGLRWAGNVSKTRCDVLIVAELGTQSGKARKAKEYAKPVFSADEFYEWLEAESGAGRGR